MDIKSLYETKQLESILSNSAFRTSGLGAALAIPFAIFHTELGFKKQWIEALDSLFALSAIVFMTYLVHLMSTTHRMISENHGYIDKKIISGSQSKITGFILLLGILFGGIYFIDLASRSCGAGMAATVIGFIMLGSSLTLLMRAISNAINRR